MVQIVCFTVACVVAKPLNRSEAKVDLVMIQTSLLTYYILVSITTRSSSASLQIKGLATKYTTVRWLIPHPREGVLCQIIPYSTFTDAGHMPMDSPGI